MRPPRLRVALHQRRVLCVQKYHPRVQQRLYVFQNLRQAVQRGALADVHHNRGLLHFIGFAHQSGKIRQKFQRQVIYAMKSQVLKGLQRRGLARARNAGHNHQFLGWLA